MKEDEKYWPTVNLPKAHTVNSDHHTTLEEWVGGRNAVTTILRNLSDDFAIRISMEAVFNK